MPGYVVGQGFRIDGLKISFHGVNKPRISELLTPTPNIFNTGTETVSFSPKDFELNKKIETENFIKSTQFIQDGYFLYDKSNIIKDLL